ncbi:MAG: NADH-quinone oxidoreductase subunit NuoK [Alphaproteobacteria bacterium]
MEIGLAHYLVVGLLVFLAGIFTVLTRRNAIGVLMGVELVLNSANINYIAFSRFGTGGTEGQVFSIFVIMLAAAEAAIGLAIVLGIYRKFQTIDVEEVDSLRG